MIPAGHESLQPRPWRARGR